jgi:hypothetical protein
LQRFDGGCVVSQIELVLRRLKHPSNVVGKRRRDSRSNCRQEERREDEEDRQRDDRCLSLIAPHF